jgi:hypothetical protein
VGSEIPVIRKPGGNCLNKSRRDLNKILGILKLIKERMFSWTHTCLQSTAIKKIIVIKVPGTWYNEFVSSIHHNLYEPYSGGVISTIRPTGLLRNFGDTTVV